MSPFTDEDLKRVKDDTNRTLSGVYFKKSTILALLARLEAAEKVIDDIDGDDLPSKSYIAWRKAAGK